MPRRRTFIARAFAGTVAVSGLGAPAGATPTKPDPKWHAAALAMQRLAESWGDQSYGAVLVSGDTIVG